VTGPLTGKVIVGKREEGSEPNNGRPESGWSDTSPNHQSPRLGSSGPVNSTRPKIHLVGVGPQAILLCGLEVRFSRIWDVSGTGRRSGSATDEVTLTLSTTSVRQKSWLGSLSSFRPHPLIRPSTQSVFVDDDGTAIKFFIQKDISDEIKSRVANIVTVRLPRKATIFLAPT